ncbi:MAG: F0F1 ATP synthase subunit A [Cryomorphaceae bacterium]|nr:F0F1 ATP synthase subunit A [Cryomorphaceae bacterium]
MHRNIFFSLLLLLPFGFLRAQDVEIEYSADDTAHNSNDLHEDEDINAVIMHHVSDSHDWHVLDWSGKPVGISLPVILFTNEGLITFSSGRFHHDDAGKEVVEVKGQRFVKYHEKIYLANAQPNANGVYLDFDEDHHPTNAKPVDISITKNVASLFVTALLMLIIILPAASFYKKNGSQTAPKGMASFLEPLIVFVRDEIALVNIGHKHYGRFVPYLLSLFFFIWIANMLGLIPFVPGGANLSGNIAFTMVLAVLTLIIVNINGKKDYWAHIFWMPGVPIPVRILLAPIELVSVFAKPFALMIRLFANMTAGHIVILSLISLIFVLDSIWVSPAAIILTLFIFVIKVLVALLQAYIFALLTALFIGQAVEEHEHH